MLVDEDEGLSVTITGAFDNCYIHRNSNDEWVRRRLQVGVK
jgi:hypothetical protein